MKPTLPLHDTSLHKILKHFQMSLAACTHTRIDFTQPGYLGPITDKRWCLDHMREQYVYNFTFIYCIHLCTEYQNKYSEGFLPMLDNCLPQTEMKVKHQWPLEGIHDCPQINSKFNQNKLKYLETEIMGTMNFNSLYNITFPGTSILHTICLFVSDVFNSK